MFKYFTFSFLKTKIVSPKLSHFGQGFVHDIPHAGRWCKVSFPLPSRNFPSQTLEDPPPPHLVVERPPPLIPRNPNSFFGYSLDRVRSANSVARETCSSLSIILRKGEKRLSTLDLSCNELQVRNSVVLMRSCSALFLFLSFSLSLSFSLGLYLNRLLSPFLLLFFSFSFSRSLVYGIHIFIYTYITRYTG